MQLDNIIKLSAGLCISSVILCFVLRDYSSKSINNNVKPQYDLYDQNGVKQLNCLPEDNYDKSFIIKIQNNNETNISVSMFELYDSYRLSFDTLKPNEIKSFKNPDPDRVAYNQIKFEIYDINRNLIGIISPNCKIK